MIDRRAEEGAARLPWRAGGARGGGSARGAGNQAGDRAGAGLQVQWKQSTARRRRSAA